MQPGQGEFMAPAQPIQQPKKEAKGGALVAISIICLLIGIGGVGFGIYQMTQKPKTATSNNQDLKIQIEKDDGTVVEIEANKITNDGSTVTITDSVSNIGGNYIYLGKHRKADMSDGGDEYKTIAIKLPEEGTLEYLSFDYRDRALFGSTYISEFVVNAITPNTIGAQALPDFVRNANEDGDNDKALGAVYIYPADIFAGLDYYGGTVVKETDDYVIVYAHPQALFTRSEDEKIQNWEKETVEAIQAWLTDESNYIEL